jgi:hypothetical protein
MVRRCLAENIEPYVKVIAKNMVRNIHEGIDIIRIKALEILPVVTKFFNKEEFTDKFVKYIKVVDKDKNAWRIRYSLTEAWATVLDELEK